MSIGYNPTPQEARANYDVYFARLDTANIVATLDHMILSEYGSISVSTNFKKNLPSIVSAFQPKSGGTYLHNRMLQAGYSELWWGFTHPQDFATVYALPKTLAAYLGGGCTAHSHFLPHPHTLSILDGCKVPKVWVHLRDPAECIVSAFHHFMGEGHGEGEVGAMRRRLALEQAKSLNLPSNIDEFIRKHLADTLIWPLAWLRFEKAQPDAVVLTSYKELVDAKGLVARIMHEFGYVGDALTVSNEPQANDRFREKIRSRWSDGVSPTVATFVRNEVDEQLRLFSFYEKIRAESC